MNSNTPDINDDPQAWASRQGKSFEEVIYFLLQAKGWTVLARNCVPEPGFPEIDIIAEDPSGSLWYIECKGSWRGDTPGLIRGDTTKKAVAIAYDLMPVRQENSQDGETPVPFAIITSHFPNSGTLGEHMLRRALDTGAVNAVMDIHLREWEPPHV